MAKNNSRNRYGSPYGNQRSRNPPPRRPGQSVPAAEPVRVGVDPAAAGMDRAILAYIRQDQRIQQELAQQLTARPAPQVESRPINSPINSLDFSELEVRTLANHDGAHRSYMAAVQRELARRIDDEMLNGVAGIDTNRVHDSVYVSTPDPRRTFDQMYQEIRRRALEVAPPRAVYTRGATHTGRMSSSDPVFQELPRNGGARTASDLILSMGRGRLVYGDWEAQARGFSVQMDPTQEPPEERRASLRVSMPEININSLAQALGVRMDEAAQSFQNLAKALKPDPVHPDAGKLVVPPRKITRTIVGFTIEAIRAPNGGVTLRTESQSVEINFKRSRVRIKRSTL